MPPTPATIGDPSVDPYMAGEAGIIPGDTIPGDWGVPSGKPAAAGESIGGGVEAAIPA